MQSIFGLKNNKILTNEQVNILRILFNDTWIKDNFYLTGGTALSAFYLQHRLSDDLDLFTHDVDLSEIMRLIPVLFKSNKIKHLTSSASFNRFSIDEIKVDFVIDVPFRVGTTKYIDDLVIDNLDNIAVNKVCAIMGRLDIKDYVDLYFLLNQNKYKINSLIEQATHKDSGVNVFDWAGLLSDIKTFSVLPKMICDIKLEELVDFYSKLQKDLIRSIKP